MREKASRGSRPGTRSTADLSIDERKQLRRSHERLRAASQELEGLVATEPVRGRWEPEPPPPEILDATRAELGAPSTSSRAATTRCSGPPVASSGQRDVRRAAVRRGPGPGCGPAAADRALAEPPRRDLPVADELLAPTSRPASSVDRLGGRARVSFVAFEFARTRLYGLAIPGHTRFPEINLRFYVARGHRPRHRLHPRVRPPAGRRPRRPRPLQRAVPPDPHAQRHPAGRAGRLRIDHTFGPGRRRSRPRSTPGARSRPPGPTSAG